MKTIEVFEPVADILVKFAKELVDIAPKDGVDFTASASSPISPPSRKPSDREITLQVQAFRKIQEEHLPKALKLAEELSVRPDDSAFTDEGIKSLIVDIGEVNTAGFLFVKEASDLLKVLKKGSPQAELILLAYAQAKVIYDKLSLFIARAKPRGSLPAVNPLKSLK